MNPGQDQFKGHRPEVTFSFKDNVGGHEVRAHSEPHGVVGRLDWAGSGEIQDVKVHEKFRRQGIATGMLNEAKRIAEEKKLNPIKHSEERTKSGDAWAKSTGDELPPKKRPGSR